MKVKNIVAKSLLKVSLTAAKVSCNSASALGFCQTKEPADLAKKLAQIETQAK
jgi:cyclic lactone autoinducer peptide